MIFDLFCYNDETYMQSGEFKFMLNKLCSAIGSTIQVKQTFLVELLRNVDQKLLGKKTDYIFKYDFVCLMGSAFKELNERLLEITNKCDILSLQMRKNRLPDYLKAGNIFLGQYKIVDTISYQRIFMEKLMHLPSVFQDLKETESSQDVNVPQVQSYFNLNLNAKSTSHKVNSSTISKESKSRMLQQWQQPLNHMFLFGLNYAYRAKTHALFTGMDTHVFEFFVADDQKFEQFYLYQNLWRETLLLKHFDDPRVPKIMDFG